MGCATDWVGMSQSDVGNVARNLQDMSTFDTQVDHMLQGFVNFQFLGRLVNSTSGFVTNPAFQSSGKPLFRTALYYICLLLVVAATLPNWYVPRTVRRENQAVDSLRQYSTAMRSYMTTSKDKSYPPDLSALAASAEASQRVSSGILDSELICAHSSCIKNGYRFEYRPEFKEKRATSYTISARPLEFEETGKLSFLLNADGSIHQTREDRDALLTDGTR